MPVLDSEEAKIQKRKLVEEFENLRLREVRLPCSNTSF